MTTFAQTGVRALADAAAAVAWLRQQGVRHLQCDSRKVQPGDAFVAWPGFATDGRQYVPAALQAGAVACVVEADGLPAALDKGLWAGDALQVVSAALVQAPTHAPVVASLSQLKAVTGTLAAAFYGHPSRQLNVVAVTGTNGKTSLTWWLAQALAALDKPCGVMGTLGVGVPGTAEQALNNLVATGLTTPDPVLCQATLRRWADQGVWGCAVEASSIGIAEHRLSGTELAVAVFTNFTQDHLDYHGDMAAYWQAKRALFDTPGLRAAVVNIDDVHGAELAAELSCRAASTGMDVWATSLDPGSRARLAATDLQPTPAGMRFTVREQLGAGSATAELAVPFVGDYNAANLLGVLATLRALGVPLIDAVQACAALTAVPGRMAPVNGDAALTALPGAANLPRVLVDYAHTPDALDKALAALRPVAALRGGALHCVVGCGGDRDASKRPLMAASAEAGASHVCLTSDNPRSEDPQTILAQMAAGLKNPADARIEPDRARAIAQTLSMAQPHDVVLIAGKGHETTQDVRGVKHPFSDHAHALAALRNRLMETADMSASALLALLPQLSGAQVMGRLPEHLSRVHTDTRSLQPGDLFVALKGDTFDAHDFLPQAAAAGAVAAVAQQGLGSANLPGVHVPDTRLALGELATLWRKRFSLPLVAVTGSNGKTTVTQMVASILRAAVGGTGDDALATQGNLNNDLGVPQTLLRLRDHHRLAVVELGMNHPGEIAVLAAMAHPTVALVNNAQREHQEFMGTVEAVAIENGQVLCALPADGVAVFPSDDAYAHVWHQLAGQRRCITFSDTDATADITCEAHWADLAWHMALRTPAGQAHLTLQVAGRHNVRNALAACACALAAGVPLLAVAQGLSAFEPVKGRSRALGLHTPAGALTVVDDTYNANPDSVRAAIDVLAALPAPRLLVLGDMGEVGNQALAFHLEVLQHAAARGIDHVWCTGAHMAQAVAAWADGQPSAPAHTVADVAADAVVDTTTDAPAVRHVPAMVDLTAQVLAASAQGGSVLVKGSRFMKMEQVVQALQAQWPTPAPDTTPSTEGSHAA